jgi:hypothetical protein
MDSRLSISMRTKLSRALGGSCSIFVFTKNLLISKALYQKIALFILTHTGAVVVNFCCMKNIFLFIRSLDIEFRTKAVAARGRLMSQFSINVLFKSTEQVLCREVGCAELPGVAVKGSEIHRDG